MVIYGNNLAEKLQGLAISKDFLKYNTPFCDIVDDPDFEVDINLALGFNSAITGNEDAAIKFVQDLTLNSNMMDNSSVEFYVHKMTHNPIFTSAIKEMRMRWDDLNGASDDFQDKLKDALKDCLNSPCNLFQETSDSMGRMAQSASTRTSDNTMGSLSFANNSGNPNGEGDEGDSGVITSLKNMVDGMDQAITNKIPKIFSNAFTEVVSVADKAFTNTQDVLMGKKNLQDLVTKVQEGKSFRDPAKVFRYSPDVKANFDYSAAASNVLSKIKEDIGGCFNRFEFKYRYNPYENNMSRPIGSRVGNSNGRKYDSDATGNPNRSAQSNGFGLDRQTTTSNPGDNLRANTVTLGKAITTDTVKVSKSYLLDGKTKNNRQNYSIFASLIDTQTKTLWYEKYDKTPGDKLTLQGMGNLGQNFRIGASVFGNDGDYIKRALNDADTSDQEKKKYGTTTMIGNYNTGFKHQLDDEGMETLFNTPNTKILNDGVAISTALFREFINDPDAGIGDASYKDPQLQNEFFVAARPVGSTNDYKYYKITDSNDQSKINVDFTVGAWSHYMKSFGLGELQAASEGAAKREKIIGTKWTKVQKIFTNPKAGQMEVRICTGPLEEVKDAVSSDTTVITAEEQAAALEQLETGVVANTGGNVVFQLKGKKRSGPLQPRLENMIREASERTGYKIVVFSGGQMSKSEARSKGAVVRGDDWYLNGRVVRTGSIRHDNGYAADIQVWDGGTRLSAENSSHYERLRNFAGLLKSLGMESYGAGPGYMNGNHHVDIAFSASPPTTGSKTWGTGTRSANTPQWLKDGFINGKFKPTPPLERQDGVASEVSTGNGEVPAPVTPNAAASTPPEEEDYIAKRARIDAENRRIHNSEVDVDALGTPYPAYFKQWTTTGSDGKKAIIWAKSQKEADATQRGYDSIRENGY